ncbi:tRNA synthetases class I-domain-containing protein [Bombardia bombarda]|uniref:valine--tRNA ligase n=1 Tax=Bombardia bombarda TaxID=252184 RepID=A0AA40C9R2_9PEZI|nr:tRNA synthetases class I-domain-containing protein [Bombardia bombarda]
MSPQPSCPVLDEKILKALDHVHHKAYNPKVVESAWYAWWESQGFFEPKDQSGGSTTENTRFVITAPPPNVTGALHCGHALATSLQDAMIRWNRMHGLTTLWRRETLTRHDLGRNRFIQLVQGWKDEYRTKINTVLRRMGGSYDWTREAFTMDQNFTVAVTEAFCQLHEQGYIYRSNRLVNWCVQLNTALSNLEVVSKELTGRTLLDVPGYDRKVEFGVLVHFYYVIEDEDGIDGGKIEVATTRPETMLGDTGIAVHPDDKRYASLIGKKARHPFVDRLIPIVADTYVDPEFGTGAVKITPAHDLNDFELGARQGLETINILNDDGSMNENGGIFQGMQRFDIRYAIVEELTKKGLLVKKVDNAMKVPLCEKFGDVIEPLIKPQWWLKTREMADAAILAARNGDIKIRPETAESSYFRWLEKINDWCLLRYVDNDRWVVGRTEQEATQRAREKFPGKTFKLVRDGDVLDTWFSSGLWPFATLGWPNATPDFDRFYPTSVLETGWDILFFWVARMVILGIKLTGKSPFREVYCHPLVRDTEGRKVSKSLGNVIDPVDVIQGIELQALHDKLLTGNLDPKEVKNATRFQKTAFPQGIPECGADALRFCLIQYCTGGGDVNFDIKVMHGYRKFCNKAYQATKYGNESLAERWILHKKTHTAKNINEAMAHREFAKSTGFVYQYWYASVCDVFIENSKALIQGGTEAERLSVVETMYTALESGLAMLHPGRYHPSIMVATYPSYTPEMDDPQSETAYELVMACSRGMRSLISEYALKKDVEFFIQAHDDKSLGTISDQINSILSLVGRGDYITNILSPGDARPPGCVALTVTSSATIFLFIRDRVDIEAEIEKAKAKLAKAYVAVERQSKLVADPKYRQKVSEGVLEADGKKLAELEAQVKTKEETVDQFERLKLE